MGPKIISTYYINIVHRGIIPATAQICHIILRFLHLGVRVMNIPVASGKLFFHILKIQALQHLNLLNLNHFVVILWLPVLYSWNLSEAIRRHLDITNEDAAMPKIKICGRVSKHRALQARVHAHLLSKLPNKFHLNVRISLYTSSGGTEYRWT